MPFVAAGDSMPLAFPSLSTEPASPRILVRCLFRNALAAPNLPAVHDLDSGNAVTWKALAGQVLCLAEQLRVVGVRAGQRIAVAIANRSEAPVVSLALQQLGAVEVAMGNRLSETDLLARLEHIEASVLIVDSRRVAGQMRCHLQQAVTVVALFELPCPVAPSLSNSDLHAAYRATDRLDPDATALILWTSGTQSRPRGAMLSHQALASNAAGKLQAVPQDSSDRRLTVLPLSHAYARTCDMGTWLLTGGTLAVSLGWKGLLHAAPRVQPTLINVVPSLARKLLSRLHSVPDPRQALTKLGLARLRLLGCGGAPLSAEDFLAFRRLGILVIHGYGLTEAGPVVCSATPDDAAPGVVGKPIAGVQIRIDFDQRLWIRGPSAMQGYWGEPEISNKKWSDGWLDTGDLARREEGGQITLLGRADDTLVLANGRKLQPFALEQACCRLPGIRHAVLYVDEGRLVLLLDCDQNIAAHSHLEQTFGSFPFWQRPERIACLPRALSYEQNELTAKGTVRRGMVIERWRGYQVGE